MIDARWLENVTVDVTELKIEYRTADCVERDDFTVQLIYNNDISNSTVTNTSDYVANTTKHFFIFINTTWCYYILYTTSD